MALERIAGFDFHPVEFDRDGAIVDQAQVDALLDAVGGGLDDLLVLSHGWNNDTAEARRLYTELLGSIAANERDRLRGRRVAVLGVFWPSKKFADRDLIPGGAASVGGDLPGGVLEAQLVGLRDVLGEAADQMLVDASKLDSSRAARRRFGEAIQAALLAQVDADEEAEVELPGGALSMPGEEMFDAIDVGELGAVVDSDSDAAPLGVGTGLGPGPGAATGDGGAAFFGGLFRGVRSSASLLLNLTTYWAMKRRAGAVGRIGLNPVLHDVLDRGRRAAGGGGDAGGGAGLGGPRLHLVGHSFGARLLTAAVLGSDGEPGGPVDVHSLVLLQAAFSHHGFAVDYHDGRDGHFRPVVAGEHVRGALLITHTPNDLANRWAYPAASRLARHTGAAAGNPESLYGALGTNGAQDTPGVVVDRLRAHTASYALRERGVHNLEGSDFISGHGDVAGAEVANAVLAAVALGAGGAAGFDPSRLDRTTIAIPLLDEMQRAASGTRMHVTIDLNLRHPGGAGYARAVVTALLLGADAVVPPDSSAPGTAGGGDQASAGGREADGDGDDTVRTGMLSDAVVDHLAALGDGERPRGLAPAGDGRWLAIDPLVDWPGIVGDAARRAETRPLVDAEKGELTPQYVHARLTDGELRALVELDAMTTGEPAIYKIWPDFEVSRLTTRSVRTVKADAARAAFAADGAGVVWAVADTGVDSGHEHFERHGNLHLAGLDPIAHQDFVDGAYNMSTSEDPNGHGTHVAGIIAGESLPPEGDGGDEGLWVEQIQRDSAGEVTHDRWRLHEPIRGVAPRTTIVSLRVLDENGKGRVSNLLAAIGYVQRINDHGRWIRIHGLNLSVGYGFDPEWFACGQSPLCVEVDRLVRSGVSVVVAAGNTGYLRRGGAESPLNAGLDLTINDPGNADLAITVGATHRDKPHVYGVSYFSSKGPTGDGRIKPDLVAPGEKIISCAAGSSAEAAQQRVGDAVHYRADSGTSMAAPHVSGAIAAFLSIRPEFVGQPTRVKEIFLDSATDLGRERYFQGRGLVDLMRAIQSV